ncbi:hypothetical protein KL905_001591 [Ogataea polymorpha]|uniref:Uncharacterized protein n=1 Tax=Ogataea polymorpha TaxID=460523 RepID=A0A1B7SF42_9ASCO|nr:uncharacterized protein OGAPODRAFT_94911 [Ogataea polymorpha]KAG7882889.1 hypothetical protein KL937_000062 [Ogataea polymorpha]KAG7889677.1 hypothetical protein KL908_004790 [Ogataea polymorpha]KAG7895574.1 hypothetical protein KL936_000282 [Ogataea polymorpha]KAG7904349.1 hypothetical protein KL935_000488 [Ogataea polymorpha]KAG7908149.1 hypothetical protein KL907_001639 [Ogataea polymorpha]
MAHLERYKTTLNESLDKSQNLLNTLVDLKKKEALDDADIDLLNSLHREAVLDNVQLINAKNEVKSVYNKLADDNLKKLHSGHYQFNNMKIQRYKGQKLRNESLAAEFSKLISQIPELELDQVLDNENTEDREFLNGLRKSGLDIRLQFAKSDFSDQIDETIVSRVEEILKNEEVKKFRLVQLNDKHYERERAVLQSMSLKWQNRLAELMKFVKDDSSRLLKTIEDVKEELREEHEEELEEEEVEEEEEEEEEEREEEKDGQVEDAEDAEDGQDDAMDVETENQVASDERTPVPDVNSDLELDE